MPVKKLKQHASQGAEPRPSRTEAAVRVGLAHARHDAEASREELSHELEVHGIELAMQNEELRRTQGMLAESRDRYVDLYDFAPVGYFTLDAVGAIAEVNLAGAAMLGVERGRLVGQLLPRYVAPDDAGHWHRFTRELIRSGESCRVELGMRVGETGGFQAQIDGQSSRGPDAAPVLRITLTDVTQRKRAEAALRDSEAFLERTGRIARVGGWELNIGSGAITWSDQTCRIHEVPSGHRPDMEGALRFFAPPARAVIEGAVNAAIRNGKPWDLELPLITAKGRAIWVRVVGEVECEAGHPKRIAGAYQDITERVQSQAEVRREQALRAQIEHHASQLDALLGERGAMLDVLAHEVRQPLSSASAVLQNAAAALAELGEKRAASRLASAQAMVGQVMANIDNTLAVATLLAQSEPVFRVETDIDTLVAVVVLDLPAQERHRIQVELATPLRTVSMDMPLMRLALRNLLNNALKYSPPGSPVSVLISGSDVPMALVIEVSDAGTGVPPDVVPRMFERGARGKAPNGAGGHGLGLYIVRRVMELHGGGVALVRNTAQGVTMQLTIDPPQKEKP
jgi:PAS domain S-box-containing protein